MVENMYYKQVKEKCSTFLGEDNRAMPGFENRKEVGNAFPIGFFFVWRICATLRYLTATLVYTMRSFVYTYLVYMRYTYISRFFIISQNGFSKLSFSSF